MNRRSYLKYAGVSTITGLSGCLDRFGENTDNSTQQISISNMSANPTLNRYDLNFDIDIIQDESTIESPPKIKISIEQTTDYDIVLSGMTRSVFDGVKSESGTVLLLQEAEIDNLQVVNDNCWRLENEMALTGTQYESRFFGEESQENTFNVIGNYNTSDCIPTGEYVFSTDYQLQIPDEQGNQDIESFEWGFALNINNVN